MPEDSRMPKAMSASARVPNDWTTTRLLCRMRALYAGDDIARCECASFHLADKRGYRTSGFEVKRTVKAIGLTPFKLISMRLIAFNLLIKKPIFFYLLLNTRKFPCDTENKWLADKRSHPGQSERVRIRINFSARVETVKRI
jgi:hypothetical protein